jgi:hypothetical protein
MKRWRLRISRFTPVAVLLFAAGVAVPRQGLVFHQHAGGDHFHVHGDELTGEEHESAAHHDHNHDQHHAVAHHDHGAAGDDDDVAFEAPEPVHLGHWHSQPPFHRVVARALATLIRVFAVMAIATDVQVDADARPLLPDRARAPPAATVS